ncbi:MAG: protein translocase subunit SecD [Bifidobacteriaceae bacterium]|nr:protein translocase subunit SecD [Bifidobacteriaceae bacterium]
MATYSKKARPGRTLAFLAVLVVGLFGAIGVGFAQDKTGFLPKFALDLEGGTQLVLTPQSTEGNREVTTEQIDQAIDIIRSRVDSQGVAEAEIARQGNSNIVVSIPGNPSQEDLDLVTKSAKMTFRTVLYAAGAIPQNPASWSTRTFPNPSATPSPSPTASADPASPAAEGEETPAPDASPSAAASPAPATGVPVPKPTSKVNASTGNMPVPPDEAYTARLENGLNESVVYGEVIKQHESLLEGQEATVQSKTTGGVSEEVAKAQVIAESINCNIVGSSRGNEPSDPDKPLVTCDESGTGTYILGPVMVQGSELTNANNSMATTQQGNTTGQWVVNIEFNSAGGKQFAAVTQKLYDACQASKEDPKRQFAIVLDDVVVSAPEVCNEVITTGQAQISGSFNQASSKTLAGQLSFGSLPINFNVDSQDQISATAGSEQLTVGLWAGLIGLVLVFIYSFFQYRSLSVVTMLSLIMALGVSYGTIVLLGWLQGYRLSLAGVAGLIVAIGITADSFIVYFERIRDEIRGGRPLAQAVDVAWLRARRTIIASDGVNFLAAVVLYMVAVGGVRGFAFTLGLTTVMDLVIVMLFTHPMILFLARRKFFAEGHPWSGLDPFRLGAPGSVRYSGRGSFRPLPGGLEEGTPRSQKGDTEGRPELDGGKRTDSSSASGAKPKAKPLVKVAGEESLSIAERKRLAQERTGSDGTEGGDL